MRKRSRPLGTRSFLTLAIVCAFANPGWAADPAAPLFEYPELLVTPPASGRIEMEAKKENSRAWTAHLAMQASAATTIAAGIFALGDNGKDGSSKKIEEAGMVALGIGSGWLVTTLGMSVLYRPFSSGLDELGKLPAKSKQEQLTRERLAEEHIARASSLSRKLEWLSIATNALASANVAAAAEKEEMAQVVGGLGVVMSAAPLLFSYYWQEVHRYHEDYKKRVYGPVVEHTWLPRPDRAGLAPGIRLALYF